MDSNLGFDTPTNAGFETNTQNIDSVKAKGVVLDNWRHTKEKLAQAQSEEKEARSNVMEYIKSELQEGTNRFSTNHFTLKVVHSPKYAVAKDDLAALNTAMRTIAEICGSEIAGQLLNWSPSLNKRAYDMLPDNAKQFIAPFLTMTYADTFTVDKE